MAELEIPFPLRGLPLKPEIRGRQKIDDVLVQSLATLLGWDGEGRRLLKCALSGSLRTTSPVVAGITNKVTSAAEHNITFSSVPTTEVMILANPNNSGDVWVNVGAFAAVDTGWILGAGDFINISINNLQDLRLYTVTIGDKVSVIWTV